jgi:hypothetical protein
MVFELQVEFAGNGCRAACGYETVHDCFAVAAEADDRTAGF